MDLVGGADGGGGGRMCAVAPFSFRYVDIERYQLSTVCLHIVQPNNIQ